MKISPEGMRLRSCDRKRERGVIQHVRTADLVLGPRLRMNAADGGRVEKDAVIIRFAQAPDDLLGTASSCSGDIGLKYTHVPSPIQHRRLTELD